MKELTYDALQLTELFHIEFLRRMGRKVEAKYYVLKGGTNLRFFFNSFRYSEDMDLDISSIEVNTLKDIVMRILESPSFHNCLEPFGIERIVPPDVIRAKQTQTTQRFKIHLITSAGEDIFTKVEFSRRGFRGNAVVESVSHTVLREYKLPPLLASHYDIQSAIAQKIEALATRSMTQARDIFDLYVLSSQYSPLKAGKVRINDAKSATACENAFEVSFEQFRDTILPYLSFGEQQVYDSSSSWDEVKLKVTNFIEELQT